MTHDMVPEPDRWVQWQVRWAILQRRYEMFFVMLPIIVLSLGATGLVAAIDAGFITKP